MSKQGELWREASKLVAERNKALLATADASGMPHITWMNVLADSTMEEVVTITAPTTQKVANIQVNPKAEWMFAALSLETVVYLSGPTRIVRGEEAREYWGAMPGKSQAYFRHYCDMDDYEKFAVLRTIVTKVVYTRPPGYRKTVVHELSRNECS